MKAFFFLLLNVLISGLYAGDNDPDMADALRADGKIWVVIIVALLILVGLFLYLFMLERRLRKLEKDKKGS